MAKGIKHTVTQLGLNDTRVSARTYTHVVTGVWRPTDAEVVLVAETRAYHAAQNFKYYQEVAAREVSQHVGHDAETIARAKAELALAPTAKEYAAVKFEQAKAATLDERARATRGVLQWSQSEGAAVKSLGQWEKRLFKDLSVDLTDQAR